jgi:hypothetical protein
MSKINLTYEKPDSIPLSSNMILDKGSGGGGGGSIVIPKMLANGFFRKPVKAKDGLWIYNKGKQRDEVLCVPVDDQLQGLDLFSTPKPWKLHVRCVFGGLHTGWASPTNCLCGSSYGGYSYYPSAELYTNYFWGAISHSSDYGWDTSVTMYPLEGQDTVAVEGEIYELEFGWDGKVLYLTLFDENGVQVNHAETPDTQGHKPSQHTSDYNFAIGGMLRMTMHCLTNTYIDLLNTYIELDGEVAWGNKK